LVRCPVRMSTSLVAVVEAATTTSRRDRSEVLAAEETVTARQETVRPVPLTAEAEAEAEATEEPAALAVLVLWLFVTQRLTLGHPALVLDWLRQQLLMALKRSLCSPLEAGRLLGADRNGPLRTS
jgi:hypothetical protein